MGLAKLQLQRHLDEHDRDEGHHYHDYCRFHCHCHHHVYVDHDDPYIAAKTSAEVAATVSTSSYLSSVKSSRLIAPDIGSRPFALKPEIEDRYDPGMFFERVIFVTF